jgi:protein subunit release factor B
MFRAAIGRRTIFGQKMKTRTVAGTRQFGVTAWRAIKANKLPPRPKINEHEIEEVFLKGGGKGGQKINKTNSKVQLKHIPTGLVVSSQYSRSREHNRARAREILASKVEELTAPSGQSRAEIVANYKQNKVRKKKQKAKKKYEALRAEKDEKHRKDTKDVSENVTSRPETTKNGDV